jgi:hypothetical protein
MTEVTGIKAQDIAEAKAARRWNLTFPEPVESRFAAEMDQRRSRAVRRVLPRTLVIYNAFLVGDHLLTPRRRLAVVDRAFRAGDSLGPGGNSADAEDPLAPLA